MKMKVKEIAKKIKRKGGELQALISLTHSRNYSRTTVKCMNENWLWILIECMHTRLHPETEMEVNSDGSFIINDRGVDILITIFYPILKER